MKYLRFFLLSLSFILAAATNCPPADAVEINISQMNAMADTCVRLIQNGDYRGAAMMYHYPPDYNEAQLAEDADGVAKSLQLFAEEFGAFTEAVPLKKSKLYVNIYASGGSHQYWAQHKGVLKRELQTTFANFGPGYLIIQMVNIVGTLEVKAIAFGLPVSGESVEKIRRVGTKMMAMMQDGGAVTNKK